MIEKVDLANNAIHVALSGSIYVDEATAIRENLLTELEKGRKNFIIDFQKVNYIDSSGLGVLVAIHKKAVQAGGSLTIKGLTGGVKQLFEITRLYKVFHIE